MRAAVGDRIVIRGKTVGAPDRHGEILEVTHPDGQPPYLVRFEDGREILVYPGGDFEIEHSAAE